MARLGNKKTLHLLVTFLGLSLGMVADPSFAQDKTNTEQPAKNPPDTSSDLSLHSSLDPETYQVLLRIDLLNQRLAADEARLPQEIENYAVQKLLDKINALETRIKKLEDERSPGH